MHASCENMPQSTMEIHHWTPLRKINIFLGIWKYAMYSSTYQKFMKCEYHMDGEFEGQSRYREVTCPSHVCLDVDFDGYNCKWDQNLSIHTNHKPLSYLIPNSSTKKKHPRKHEEENVGQEIRAYLSYFNVGFGLWEWWSGCGVIKVWCLGWVRECRVCVVFKCALWCGSVICVSKSLCVLKI